LNIYSLTINFGGLLHNVYTLINLLRTKHQNIQRVLNSCKEHQVLYLYSSLAILFVMIKRLAKMIITSELVHEMEQLNHIWVL